MYHVGTREKGPREANGRRKRSAIVAVKMLTSGHITQWLAPKRARTRCGFVAFPSPYHRESLSIHSLHSCVRRPLSRCMSRFFQALKHAFLVEFTLLTHLFSSFLLDYLLLFTTDYNMPVTDLLHPTPEQEARTYKLKRLVQSPNSFFMDIKCPGCFQITTVFSHAQTVVTCGNCNIILCQPTGGRAKLTEGCSYRKKVD